MRFSDSVRIEQPYRTKDQNWVGSWRRWNLELGDDRLKFGRHPIELKDIYLAQQSTADHGSTKAAALLSADVDDRQGVHPGGVDR